MMNTARCTLLYCGIVIVCSAATAGAQDSSGVAASAKAPTSQNYRYRVLGVFNEASGSPIENVEVSDALTGAHAMTTATGTVSLMFLPDGGSLVRLRKAGYEVQTFLVTIAPTETTPVTTMLRRSVQLPAVVVTETAPSYGSPKLRAAQTRMETHQGGYFVDEATLRRSDNSTLSATIASRIPGLVTATGQHGETFVLSARTICERALSCARPDCYVKVMLDGVPFLDPTQLGSARLDFSRLSPADYALVEFYPGGSTMPVEFASSPCGVLMLWSRER